MWTEFKTKCPKGNPERTILKKEKIRCENKIKGGQWPKDTHLRKRWNL